MQTIPTGAYNVLGIAIVCGTVALCGRGMIASLGGPNGLQLKRELEHQDIKLDQGFNAVLVKLQANQVETNQKLQNIERDILRINERMSVVETTLQQVNTMGLGMSCPAWHKSIICSNSCKQKWWNYNCLACLETWSEKIGYDSDISVQCL